LCACGHRKNRAFCQIGATTAFKEWNQGTENQSPARRDPGGVFVD
jgi:hypothetical protein